MKFIFKLRENKRIKKTLYAMICAFLLSYSFSIPSFSGRQGFNLITYASLILLSLITIFYMFVYKIKFKNYYLLLVPSFCLVAFIGTAVNSHDFRGWLTIVLLTASFFVCYLSFVSINNKRLVIDILIVALLFFAIYFIIHYKDSILDFSSFGSEGFRLGTYFDNQNDVASYCLIGFSLSFYQLLFQKSKIRLLYLFPILLITLVGLTTGSRTFVLSVLIVSILLLFFKTFNHKIVFLLTVVILLSIFIILLNTPFMETIKDRLIKMFDTFSSDSSSVDHSSIMRTVLIDYGFYLGARNIIVGFGFGGFALYSGVGTFAHANFIEVLCDFGIVGLFLFYSPYIVLTYQLVRSKTKTQIFVIPILVIYIINSFSTVFFYNKFYYILLSVLYYLTFNNSVLSPHQTIKQNIAFIIDDKASSSEDIVTLELLKNYFYNYDVKYLFISANLSENTNHKYYVCNKKGLSKRFFVRNFLIKNNIKTIVSFDTKTNKLVKSILVNLDIEHIMLRINNDVLSFNDRFFYKSNPSLVFQENKNLLFYEEPTYSCYFNKDNFQKNIDQFREYLTNLNSCFYWGRLSFDKWLRIAEQKTVN